MTLEDNKWKMLEGGYKIPYDASIPLRKLRDGQASDNAGVFDELWENLHHQGDVGLASYYSVPHLVDICLERNSFDWNYIGLCLVIEHRRQDSSNPRLPEELKSAYFDSLVKLEEYLLTNFKQIKDPTSLRLSLALFATVGGQSDLGRAIENMNEDVVKEFLEQF